MKKTNTKKTDNVLVIDLTKCNSITDGYRAIAISKFNAMRPTEMAIIRDCTITEYFNNIANMFNGYLADMNADKDCKEFCTKCSKCTKKPNVFKRFWNWITRKK